MLEKLTYDTFAQHLHAHFLVEDGAARSAAVEPVQARVAPTSPGYEAFSIVFREPSDPLPPQGMHRSQHGTIGALDLFTIRSRWDQHRLYSEAIFSRRRQEGHQ